MDCTSSPNLIAWGYRRTEPDAPIPRRSRRIWRLAYRSRKPCVSRRNTSPGRSLTRSIGTPKRVKHPPCVISGPSTSSHKWEAYRCLRKGLDTSVLSPKYEVFCCDQNGPPARRSEPDWRVEGAHLERDGAAETHRRPPLFIPTPRG